ncbi:histidinol phosphate phosphatase domain-containing protein [Elusimicrobiota bacterium]
MKIIDLHTHTFFSDGVLSPSELVYRYKTKDCIAVALTDHADYSNMEFIISSMLKAAEKLSQNYEISVIAGIELTYIPPKDMRNMVGLAGSAGAQLIVVHGETSAENVPPGTNIAAIEARCDILAHPGRLTDEEAAAARENGVFIELTTRMGHRDTNKEVAETAIKNDCSLILNTDSHAPEDMLDEEKIESVLNQCGLADDYYDILRENSIKLTERIKEKKR